MKARFYEHGDHDSWDAFCEAAYGATFLHSRRFLSYHSDRFVDRSVVIELDGKWAGVLPAARHPQDAATVVSHPGITYGGMQHAGALRGGPMVLALAEAAALLRQAGFERLQYKVVPHIYHRAPAQDDLYALHRLNARRYRCDLSSCIDLAFPLPRSDRRRRNLKKALKLGITFDSGPHRLAALWRVLEENLRRKHGVAPVHTLDEIATLIDRFPLGIETRVACLDGAVVAGVVLFNCGPAVHAQYIACSELGQESHALDAVFDACVTDAMARGARYFDFGISTEEQGMVLNEGLHRFKSEFGSSGLVHEFYELDLRSF